MQKLISLWKNESKNGNTYYTGKLNNIKIIGYENTNKTNEKQPDLTLYIVEEEKKEQQQPKEEKDIFSEFGDSISVDDHFLD